ncbi:alpha/beta hydrolase [Burkholderia pseudomallei]|nr:alpha/beta hydrolase [Burkholderia pseudomallei]PNX06942.1 alpha/beta hydrolase [Burkholderia sp. 136(2017)]PNX15563.1 alpha/beta hydrolase [Burkholderia sp. 129]PNX34176.1 alpha/beta hydrolase [Burkholderia sp. 117]PNX42663.1 alpha/beta hydrolase [Burkholderia sp. 137]
MRPACARPEPPSARRRKRGRAPPVGCRLPAEASAPPSAPRACARRAIEAGNQENRPWMKRAASPRSTTMD